MAAAREARARGVAGAGDRPECEGNSATHTHTHNMMKTLGRLLISRNLG